MNSNLGGTTPTPHSPEVIRTPEIQFKTAYLLREEGTETEVSLFKVHSLGRSFSIRISSVLKEAGGVDYSLCYLLSDEENGPNLAIKARVNGTAEITASVLVEDEVSIEGRDIGTIFRKLMREGEIFELSDGDQSTLLRVLQACIKRDELLQAVA